MRISVIIPALNEAGRIGAAIASAQSPSTTEIIVVDGGSHDATLDVAVEYGAKPILTERGRARQMNAGAAAAVGDTLLFLHADTRLPDRFDEWVGEALAEPETVAGAFRLNIDSTVRGVRFIERLINWRSSRLKMPYGDQAIFLSRGLFREAGGFPDIPIMEDFELVSKLRKRGRIRIVPASVNTSGRRWDDLGVLRTTLINQAIIAAYAAGVSPSRIARWYARGSDSSQNPCRRV